MPNWKKVVVSGSSPDLNNITANQFAKIGGTSEQFLKADGSVDSSTYLTSVGTINLTSDVTGILPVPNGGTGVNTVTAGRVLIGNGTSAITTDSGFTYSSNKLGIDGVITSNTKDIISNASSATTLIIGDVVGNDSIEQLDFKAMGVTAISITDSQVEFTGDIGIKISNAPDTTIEGTALMITSNGAVQKRDLGSNAFNSTAFSTATGVENNADVTPSWVPSVDPNYLTSVGTIDLTSGVTGILPVANGGTGLNTLTSGYIPYGNGTSAFSSNSALLFNDSIKQLRITGDSTNDPLRLSNVQTNSEENKTALILASSDGGVQKATLGSNAFNSTAIPTNNNQLANGAGYVTGAFPFTGSGGISGSLEIIGSGSGIFSVEGSVGTLFSVDDGLDDVIFAANNISGTPVIEANADNTVKLGKLGGFGIVISGSTPAPSDTSANIIITGSIQHNGSYGLGVAASATIGRFDASNDVVAFSTSDERLKKYVKNIPNALDKVSQINGVTFQWKKTDDETKQNVHSFEGKDVGVIAQEIEKVLPEVVITRDNGYKAVKYEKIIPLLIESVKELKAEIEELKKSK